MKNLIKSILFGAMAVALTISMTACTLDGTEETEGEHIGVCSVKLDFSVLEKCL